MCRNDCPRRTPGGEGGQFLGDCGVAAGRVDPDFRTSLADRHPELPPGVGLTGVAPQRHPVAQQIVPLGVEVHTVQPHRQLLHPATTGHQVPQLRQHPVRSRVVGVPTF